MIPDKIEWDPEAKSWIASKDTPDAITAEWDGEKWVKGKNPSGPGSLRRGFATGVESTKGLVADIIPAMVQSAFGYDEAAQKNLQEYRDRMKALEARNLLTRMDYQKVNDLGSAAEFAGEAIGESIPSLITTLAGGVGVGAAAARLGAGRLLTQQVGKKAAELEAKGVAKDAALQQATKEVSQQVGSVAGAFGGSALLNIPESYLNLAEAGNASLGASFAVGALKSTLDALGPIRLLSKTRGPDFSDKVTDLVSARLLKGRPGAAGALGGALETAALEGITEGTQQLLDETAAAILADKSIDWNNIINAALKGGVGSAPVGAAAGAYGARQKAASAAEAEAKKQQALEARQKYQQETEAALSLPEDLMLRREFGEIKDSASYEKLANYFANAAKKAKGTQKERLTEEAQRYSALAQTADTEKIVSQLASYFGFNQEQEAALLKSATDFTGPGRAQFENFVAETLKDPAVAGRIPGLQNVEFLSVVPPTTTLALPAPTAASFEIPDYGTVTARQADEIISRFQSRPVMEGADTRDRDEKLAELQQLDPNVNPNVVTMDPNERRRIALGIITRKDIKQIEKPTGEPVGTVETETGKKPTDTVPKTETISTVGAAGQLGTRTEMGTFDNLYQRIVANMDNAPEGTLGLNWLLGAAGVSRQNAATPEGQVAADTVKQNAAQIWNQLVADGYVTRRGALGFTAVPADQRETAAASTEVGRLVRLPSLSEALGDAYVSGLTTGKPQLLGIDWLTRALGVPVSPTTARTVWTTLQNQGRVAPAGMGKYRATVWPQGETPSPAPATPPPPPTPPTPQPPAPAPKMGPPQPPAPKPQPKAPAPKPPAPPTQVFENIYNAYLRSVGSKWNKVGIGPILTLDKLLREVQKTSGPNYTMENLGKDLMLINANPDLRSDSGSMVEFPSSTIARDPKIPRVHVPYRGTTITFYGIRFSQDPDFQKSKAESAPTYAPGTKATTSDGTTGTIESVEDGMVTIIPDGSPNRRLQYPIEALEGPVSAKSAREDIPLAIDPEVIKNQFGASAYKERPDKVAVKELFQNAFDAVKEALFKGLITVPKIDVAINPDENSITVTDNGTGMDIQTLKKGLFTVGGSKKGVAPELRSGGLGKAKMAIFSMAKKLEVVTVKDGVMLSVSVSGDRVFESMTNPNAKFPVSIENTDRPNGTTVKITLRDSYIEPETEEKKPISLKEVSSYTYPATTEFLLADSEGIPIPSKFTFTSPSEDSSGSVITLPLEGFNNYVESGYYAPFTKLDFRWGTVIVYKAKNKTSFPVLKVLSSGLPQFSDYIFLSFGDIGTYDFDLVFDIRPKVEGYNPFYPFNATREGFNSSINKDIDQIQSIFRGLTRVAQINLDKQNLEAISVLPIVDPNKPQKVSGLPVPLQSQTQQAQLDIPPKLTATKTGGFTDPDTGKPWTPASQVAATNLQALSGAAAGSPLYMNNLNVPIIGSNKIQAGNPMQFFSELAAVFNQLRDEAAKILGSLPLDKEAQDLTQSKTVGEALEKYKVGVGIDKDWHGVNFLKPVPVMFVNPLGLRKDVTIPGAVSKMYRTMVHELAHVQSARHSEDFTQAHDALDFELANAGADTAIKNTLSKVFTRHFKLLNELKDVFNDPNTENRKSGGAASFSRIESRPEEGGAGVVSGNGRRVVSGRGPSGVRERGQEVSGTGKAKQESGRLPAAGGVIESRFDDQAVTPAGAPQKVAAEARNMLDRIGRQEDAANKSVSDDYSCG